MALPTVPTTIPRSSEHGIIHTKLMTNGNPKSFEYAISTAVTMLDSKPSQAPPAFAHFTNNARKKSPNSGAVNRLTTLSGRE